MCLAFQPSATATMTDTIPLAFDLPAVRAKKLTVDFHDDDGMRQEVDVRYVVTSLEGDAQHLYEEVCCKRGQKAGR